MTELEEKLEKSLRLNERLSQENKLLRQKVDYLIRKLYGVSQSEQIDKAQLELLLEGLGQEPGKDEASASANELVEAQRKEKSRRSCRQEAKPRVPENLPVVEEIIDPEPVKACPEAWRQISQEVSEQLDLDPPRFFWRRQVRRRYVRRDEKDQVPVIAPLPPKLQEKCLAAPGLLSHVIISKYCDHLPLYRQEQIYAQRYGVNIPRQTLARWVELGADWLRPIYKVMLEEMFSNDYLQVDETPVRYLDPGGGGKTKLGYLWTYHQPGGDTLYDWQSSRAHNCLLKVVPDSFNGVMQCDAYGAYQTFATKRSKVELAGCMAHARRRFYEALDQDDSTQRSAWVLHQMNLLYGIERRLRENGSGPRLREAVRQNESRMIMQRIEKALRRFKASGHHLPQGAFGKALSYALDQWPLLETFLRNGKIEIDNNLVENAIRPTAVGKKNWLFVGADGAGWRSAVCYSIITSCRNHGIDPHEYLRDVLERLPTMTNHQLSEITPRAWARAIREASQSARIAA